MNCGPEKAMKYYVYQRNGSTVNVKVYEFK